MLWYAAAGVSQYVSDEYERMARETVGRPIPFLTGLGSTETAPFAIGRSNTRQLAGAPGSHIASAPEPAWSWSGSMRTSIFSLPKRSP